MSTTTSNSLADRFMALTGDQRVRLLRRLVEAGRTEQIPDVVPHRDGDGPVRLSPAQEALWVYESLYPETSALNLACSYHFDRPVDPGELERALTIVQEQHDILRMTIEGTAGELRIDFPPCGRFELERVDLRETGATLEETLVAFGHRPFNLYRDRLIRGAFITVDDTRSTLVLGLHHIVTDWWSFDVLHTEFVEAYRAVHAGTAHTRSRPDIQYADFSCWQRELEAAGVFEAQLDFWRTYLAELPPPLVVGGSAPTGEAALYLTEQSEFHVDAATEAAARAFARRHDGTVYGVLMAAFAVLAHRLSGRDDFVIGTPTANRSAKGLDRVIGYVMNAVPTRWRIAPGDTFSDLVRRFTAEFPTLLANADVPVGRMVSAAEPERWHGRSPLYQWVFMHLPRQQSTRVLREIAEPERVHTGGEHDIVGVIRDTEDGLHGSLHFRTDVYERAAVRRWSSAFGRLIGGLLAAPDAPVDAIALLDDAERAGFARANDTALDLAPASLADLVARKAARTPDAVAVECGAERLTYAELLARADRLAGALRHHGTGLVGIALGRGIDHVVAVLGTLRAGCPFLPIDPAYPEGRIRHLLTDARPMLVITAESLPELLASRPMPPPGSERTDPHAAAYVMYTSGSTGHPKGVVVTHSGIASLAVGLAGRFGLHAGSRVLQQSSPSFDMSVGEMCMAFGAGGTLVIAPPGPLAGDELARFLRERDITCTLISPAVLASVPPGDFPRLAVICLGGDVCPAELVAAWTTPGRRCFNGYGPTETTVGPTFTGPLPVTATPPPIGRPILNARVHALDRRLTEVPVGVPGELYVAGHGLARGYLGQPGHTAERFVANPFAPGERMYRTGDLVRWREDGQLDFLGRVDDQLSVRGVRVEPAEITAALLRHPAVTEAAVLLRDGALVAYAVADRTADELIRHLLAELPLHLVPSAVVPLPALPTNAHGKLDRAALPAPAGEHGPAAATGSPQESRMRELFAEVLGVPEVGAGDDFFALGGDSIVAIRLVGRARDAGISLALRDVFAARTPAGLAVAATTAVGVHRSDDPGEGRFPPTPVMHWWHEHGGNPDAFTMSALFPVPAGLDRQRIAGALQWLVDRHGALRIRLLRHAPQDWELEVPAAGPRRLEAVPVRVDADRMSEEDIRAAARVAARNTRLAPENGRMLAATWFDAGPGRTGRLLLTVHHLAVDGVSWRILQQELADALAGGRSSGPAPGTSFRSWAHLLREHAGTIEHEFPHWTAALEATPPAAVAPDRPVSAERATLTVTLPTGRTEPLFDRVTSAFRCGPNDVLLTALLAAVVRWRRDGTALLVELEAHGREAPSDDVDLSSTVGWFTSQYPVRLDAGEAAGAAFWQGRAGTALGRVAAQLAEVPGRGLGYGLLRYLNPRTAPKLADLREPDLRFNYLGRFAESASDGVELLGVVDESGLPLTHAIELDAVTRLTADGPRLVADWSYAVGTLADADVRALADYWFAALDELAAAAAEVPLVDLSPAQIAALTEDLEVES